MPWAAPLRRFRICRRPSDPKTTFTVGTVSGGTSVNAIAAEARMTVDMRSDSTEELLKLEGPPARSRQTGGRWKKIARWKSDKLSVEIKLIGEKAARRHRRDGYSPILQATATRKSRPSPARRA